MGDIFPKPGHGYTIREYLGGGNWKSAYRASSQYNLADVALLYFHDDDKFEVIIKDVSNLVRAVSGHKFADYLAKFFGLQRGQDGKFFIIEELLARPLDRITPVNDLVQFVRIARDLSRGLCCLHDHGLVHRDLKLDNCGLDHQLRAKIFDLGSVTSEGGEVRGAVFTRAPELFPQSRIENEIHSSSASDVWALGATLFALRTGTYPFVLEIEVKERQLINASVRSAELTREEGLARKHALDQRILDRIRHQGASAELRNRIHSIMQGRTEVLLLSMLEFDPAQRPQIQFFESQWSALAQELGSTGEGASSPQLGDKWGKVKQHLKFVEQKELVLTRKQIARIIAEYESAKIDDPGIEDAEIETVLQKIKQEV